MREMQIGSERTCVKARVLSARNGCLQAANEGAIWRASLHAPVRVFGRGSTCGCKHLPGALRREASHNFSGCGPRSVLRARGIREEIIGHRMTSFRPRIVAWRSRSCRDLALAMLHEPSRKHGRGTFFNPLIHKGSHLLAKVCGMTETREFVGLKTVPRRGQQEFPRRLNVVAGHGVPPE